MADEVGAASTFLYGRLTAPGTTLQAVATQLQGIVGDRIFEGAAPAGATYPAIVFSLLASSDQSAQGDVRVFTRPLYLVKAIAKQESFAAASQAYALVDELIQGAMGYVTVNGTLYFVQRCNRESQIEYPEERELQRFSHTGGKYRLMVQTAPPAVPANLVYPFA